MILKCNFAQCKLYNYNVENGFRTEENGFRTEEKHFT